MRRENKKYDGGKIDIAAAMVLLRVPDQLSALVGAITKRCVTRECIAGCRMYSSPFFVSGVLATVHQ